MNLSPALSEAKLIRRENRFVAKVELNGQIVSTHVPNSGRCQELLFPGNTILVQKAPPGSNRKTEYSLIMAKHNGTWVCLVSVWANLLTKEAAGLGLLPPLAEYSSWKSEVRSGRSRFDFLLEGSKGRCLLEVKGVTLVDSDNNRALFPDAPTIRGKRHLEELAHHVQTGGKAAVVFGVQRSDADSISPNTDLDPEFSRALQEAHNQGVNLLGFSCVVTEKSITPFRTIPVIL